MTLNKADNLEAPMNKVQLDKRTLQIFWYNSKPEIEDSLTLLNPKTVEDALHHALVVEEKLERKVPPAKKQKLEPEIINELIEPYKNDLNNRFKQINERINDLKIVKEDMTVIKEAVQQIQQDKGDQGKRNVRFSPYSTRTCYICQRAGHTYMYCRNATQEQKTAMTTQKNSQFNTRLDSQRALPSSTEGTRAHPRV